LFIVKKWKIDPQVMTVLHRNCELPAELCLDVACLTGLEYLKNETGDCPGIKIILELIPHSP